MTHRFSRIPLLLLLTAVLLTGCSGGKSGLTYYPVTEPAPVSTTAAEDDPSPLSSLAFGASYAALPLMTVTRIALAGESYADAQLFTSAGTTEEVLMSLRAGTVDLALLIDPGDAATEDLTGFETVPVASVPLAFYVSSGFQAPISLTSAQLRDIYSGRYDGWEEIGGDTVRLLPIQRNAADAAQDCLSVLVGDTLAEPSVSLATGGSAVFTGAPGEIVCALWSPTLYADGNDVLPLAVDGVLPTEESVRDGSYPLTFPVVAVFRGDKAKETVSWLVSEEGQTIVSAAGYWPVDRSLESYRYEAPLTAGPGTGSFQTDAALPDSYYTVSEDVLLLSEEQAPVLTGLRTDLLEEINAFLAESQTALDEADGPFRQFLSVRQTEGRRLVEMECLNGYLSLTMRLVYGDSDDNFAVRSRVWDLRSGTVLTLSDLFFRDVDYLSALNADLRRQAGLPSDAWGNTMTSIREFTGLPVNCAFSLTKIYLDVSNPFFYDGVTFSLDGVASLSTVYQLEAMDGIWEDGLVLRAPRGYVPADGLEPEALYETKVNSFEGKSQVEQLVSFRLKAAALGLSTDVCDAINNAMYANLKATLSPAALDAMFDAGSIINRGYYYIGMRYEPVFYGSSIVKFRCDGLIEYADATFQYQTIDDYPHEYYFSLRTGLPLQADELCHDGWRGYAGWSVAGADGSETAVPAPDDTVTLTVVSIEGSPGAPLMRVTASAVQEDGAPAEHPILLIDIPVSWCNW